MTPGHSILPPLVQSANGVRQMRDGLTRHSSSIGGARMGARVVLVKITAIVTGPPARYSAVIVSGLNENEGNWEPSDIRGMSDEVEFSIGQLAYMVIVAGEPLRLISGGGAGGGGGRLYATGVWQR